ncbi:hypothetical protein Hte_002032 [Hypoxylon texense]
MSLEVKLDRAVLNALKNGDKLVRVEWFDTSRWATVAKVDIESSDVSFWLMIEPQIEQANERKTLKTEDAAERVLGEYMAMLEIYDTLPDFAPQPRAYGKCVDEDAHFFLCDYKSISHVTLPDPVKLGKKLAELHKKSKSPTGKFGFHVTTFDGKLPLNTSWDSSWTSFLKKLMHDVYVLDTSVNGFWKDLDDVMQVTLGTLIPRLLDPLTAEGRSIKPCLIHGDLWESNIGTDTNTGELYIFDACSYYAHHEKEIGIWRCEHHEMKAEEYRNEYFKNHEPSEPVEEFDDRNRLYSVETLLINSAHFPGTNTRQLAVDELKFLIEKYLKTES